ncbi:IclR family transcriptional regulator domain-containing protein [Nocardia brevicatena]|uniref:IclR family transcriptional regulator domain-containing protein n=1 Tax=Nocardia brevicatena TaxID=37327 RepID=UPI001FDF619F|nr:IclR family transcriptional regulator C-terminal domain-containing protein [Nocardia brevicatena]
MSFPDVIQPHLEALTREISETSMAFVLDGDEIVYVAGVQAKKLVAVQVGFGTRVPAYASPVGRVLLAALPPDDIDAYFSRVELVKQTDRTIVDEATLRLELEQVAHHGYAIGDQELAIDLRTVAVPVHDKAGKVIAAISIGVTAATVSLSALSGDLLLRLKATATEIEADLRTGRHAGSPAEP